MTPEEIDKIAAPVLSRMAMGPERMLDAPWAKGSEKLGVSLAREYDKLRKNKELLTRFLGTYSDLSDNLRRLPYTDPETYGQDDFDYLVEEIEAGVHSLHVYQVHLKEFLDAASSAEDLAQKWVLDKIR